MRLENSHGKEIIHRPISLAHSLPLCLAHHAFSLKQIFDCKFMLISFVIRDETKM